MWQKRSEEQDNGVERNMATSGHMQGSPWA